MSANLPPDPDIRAVLADEPPEDQASLSAIWTALGDAAPAPAEASDAAWTAVRARLGAPRRASDRAPERASAPRTHRRWIAAALTSAVALTAVAIGISTWRSTVIEYVAPAGETLGVALPDGSSIVLNSGATVRYARAFAHRGVTLNGEAFFDVAHDASSPFTVETPNAQVEVLGTAFNVRAYGDETDVALVRGSVRVTAGASAPTLLEPGEAVTITEARISTPAVANVERVASWQSGALAFADRPLHDVLGEIERRYGVAFQMAFAVPVEARVSAYYTSRPDIEALLGDIGAAAGVRFVPGAQGYTVRPARDDRPAGNAAPASRAAR